MSKQENAARPLTIVLRGLMVFCLDRKTRSYEIGVLPVPDHELFINTYKGAVPEPRSQQVPAEISSLQRWIAPRRLHWEFEVPGSKGGGISKLLKDPFARQDQAHSDPHDFRWIVDLEGPEFHAEKLALKTGKLKPIMHFHDGAFSTLELTDPLIRQRGQGNEENIGAIAAATLLTLPGLYADPVLRVRETGEEIFRFKLAPDTFYEIANIPPSQIPGQTEASLRAARRRKRVKASAPAAEPANNCCTPDDFQNYYELFNVPPDKRFHLALAAAPPIPDPYRCGGVELGMRDEPLA